MEIIEVTGIQFLGIMIGLYFLMVLIIVATGLIVLIFNPFCATLILIPKFLLFFVLDIWCWRKENPFIKSSRRIKKEIFPIWLEHLNSTYYKGH